jgi:hypothetical protein
MICPHCGTAANFKWKTSNTYPDPEKEGHGYRTASDLCPACSLLQMGAIMEVMSQVEPPYDTIAPIEAEELLFPKHLNKVVDPEVPQELRHDYLEAVAVLSASPKASAALSRRILQHVLQNSFQIPGGSLAQQIDAFLKRSDVPSYLTQAIDAVRTIGNFAAHPLKDTSTGAIAAVEPGEAEWLLEVLNSLFDFAFVQPKRLSDRRQNLNMKLAALGKPPLKG